MMNPFAKEKTHMWLLADGRPDKDYYVLLLFPVALFTPSLLKKEFGRAKNIENE